MSEEDSFGADQLIFPTINPAQTDPAFRKRAASTECNLVKYKKKRER